MTRREALGMTLAPLAMAQATSAETHQATGVKVGEITPSTARIWTRRTRLSRRRMDGIQPAQGLAAKVLPLPVNVDSLHGSCPGQDGETRVTVRTVQGREVFETKWEIAAAAGDFTHQFMISSLKTSTEYRYTVETRQSGARRPDGSLQGRFRTALPEDAIAPVNVAMLSCQKYSQRDDAEGFHLYDAIRKWDPHFYLSVGDNVYYDSDDPMVNHTDVARFHWHRMYSLSRIVECLRSVPGYWVKDDHDCYSDDCFPEMVDQRMAPFKFAEGLRVYPEQIPIAGIPYRTYRWGRGLQIWLLEGRDYRTANRAPDGPGKSIWGPEQKRWLQESLLASKADWKLIVSPTPVVGPDRPAKHDNHSNDTYTHEGNEFRRWLAKNTKNDTFVLCGDRHWQYHSVHPETKVQEFGCGAASDSHAGGTPGENPAMHRFHRVKGGFLAIQVMPEKSRSRLIVEHRDVHGTQVYRQEFERRL